MINDKMTFLEVENISQFESIKGYIFEARPTTKEKYRSIELSKFDFYGNNRVVDGLNFVLDKINSGENVIYDYYSKQEIELDESLKMTKLFYFKGKKDAPYVVINPGGGYRNVVTYLEGFPCAKYFVEAGLNVFVCIYRTRIDGLLPKPMNDLHKALHFIEDNKKQFEIGDKYAVLGCSAGAHLTSELMTNNYGYKTTNLTRPESLVLCYAPNKAKFADNLLSSEVTSDDFNILEHYDDCPDTYIWHCENDPLVPVEQFYETVGFLKSKGVEVTSRLYKTGGHGLQDAHLQNDDDWISPIKDYLVKKLLNK